MATKRSWTTKGAGLPPVRRKAPKTRAAADFVDPDGTAPRRRGRPAKPETVKRGNWRITVTADQLLEVVYDLNLRLPAAQRTTRSGLVSRALEAHLAKERTRMEKVLKRLGR